jgi:hypothetical protein
MKRKSKAETAEETEKKGSFGVREMAIWNIWNGLYSPKVQGLPLPKSYIE